MASFLSFTLNSCINTFQMVLEAAHTSQVHQEVLLKTNLHFPISKIKTSTHSYLVQQHLFQTKMSKSGSKTDFL